MYDMTHTQSRRVRVSILLAAGLILAAMPLLADEHDEASKPLEPFSRLVGGEWHSGANYHVMEWGLGKLSVTTKSYFVADGKPKLVSDGTWFWHPGEQSIKGLATAIDMGIDLWDYTTTFEDNVLRSHIVTYATDGTVAEYVETWEFTDDDTYVWKLFTQTDEGLQEMMGSTYTRKK
jgi:hypothetical protein